MVDAHRHGPPMMAQELSILMTAVAQRTVPAPEHRHGKLEVGLQHPVMPSEQALGHPHTLAAVVATAGAQARRRRLGVRRLQEPVVVVTGDTLLAAAALSMRPRLEVTSVLRHLATSMHRLLVALSLRLLREQ